jgi:diguanylate cyclase (GGDEF)-like protein
MSTVDPTVSPSPEALEGIIAVQQQVAETALSLDQVMRLVALRAQELTGATGALVELVEDVEMSVRTALGTARATAGRRLPVEGSLSGQAMRMGRALRCDDAEADPQVDPAAAAVIHARSLISAPVRATGTDGGVLKVVSDRAAAFDPGDARSLELLAPVISAALGRASGREVRSRQELQDPLTGLANRALFLDHLKAALGRLTRRRSTVAVLSVDLDGFEAVNEAMGRAVGDRLLVAAGGRIREIVRGTDTVARVGGDDFALVCEDAGGPRGAAWVAELVLEWLSRPFRIEGHEIELSATVGISVAAHPDTEPEALLREAGQAMYAAKSDGKGRYRFADPVHGETGPGPYTGGTTT